MIKHAVNGRLVIIFYQQPPIRIILAKIYWSPHGPVAPVILPRCGKIYDDPAELAIILHLDKADPSHRRVQCLVAGGVIHHRKPRDYPASVFYQVTLEFPFINKSVMFRVKNVLYFESKRWCPVRIIFIYSKWKIMKGIYLFRTFYTFELVCHIIKTLKKHYF